MKVGEILAKSRNRLSSYGISYRHPFDTYYDLFLANDEIKPVHIKSVLVLTDKRPRSLIAIAYAFRLTKVLKANLFAITMGLHQDLIKGEAERYKVNLALIQISKSKPSLDYILGIVRKHEIGLIVIHNLYALSEDLLQNSPIPIMVVKVDQFFKQTPPKKTS